MRVALIVNRFSQPQLAPVVELALQRRLGTRNVRTYLCDSVGRATESADGALDWGADRVAVVGGDGTVHGVARALLDRPVPMAALPGGTANDFASYFMYHRDPAEVVNILLHGRRRPVDVLQVNGVPFVTGGGIGLITAAVDTSNRCRHGASLFRHVGHLLRSGIYSAGVLQALPRLTRQPHSVELLYNDTRRVCRLIVLVASNLPVLGRRFRVAPGAKCDDGRLDLFAIHERGLANNLLSVAGTAGFGHPRALNTVQEQTERLTICLDRPAMFVGDGEILVFSDTFEVSIRAQCLTVMTSPLHAPDELHHGLANRR